MPRLTAGQTARACTRTGTLLWGAEDWVKRKKDIDLVRWYVEADRHEFYRHALTEAKKDGVEPEDVVYVLLTGKVIEEYSERDRILVYGKMQNDLPLHVVCDFSDEEVMYISTVYIPSREDWMQDQIRRRRKRKKR